MRETADKVLNQIKAFFSGLAPKERNRLIILGGVVLVLAITAALLLGRTNWVVLEAELAPARAGAYQAAIENAGYQSKLSDGGTTVLVPQPDYSAIIVALRTAGVGTPSNLSPDLYLSEASQLGMTDRDKNALYYWQRAEDVQKTLLDYEGINDAKVLLTPGERVGGVLSASNPPTASIMVGTDGNVEIGQEMVVSILSLVAGTMDGLTTDNITLTDKMGRLYDTSGNASGSSTSLRVSLEDQARSAIERQINNLLVPVVGAGNVKVSAHVELDLDDTTIESVEFAPPIEGQLDGMKVSTYRLWESSRAGDTAIGVPGTDENGIGTVEYPYLGLEEDEYYHQYVEEINYELNETRKRIVREKGAVKQLSVGILINSEEAPDLTDQILNVTAMALGVKADQAISLEYVPFAALPEPTAPTGLSDQTASLLSLAIKGLVVLLLGFAIIGFLRSIYKATRKEEQLVLAEGTGMNVDYIAGGELEDEEGFSLEEIPVAAKSESIQRLEEFIERDPAAVTQLLRNWLSDE